MNQKLYILTLFILLSFQLINGQQKISVNVENMPITELFNEIEQQSPYRFFCLPEQVDSIFITINTSLEDPVNIVEKAIEGTGLKISRYNNHIFILENTKLITTLPEDYFEETKNNDTEHDPADILLSLSKRNQKASSENKVYEIGDPSLNALGRVNLNGVITDFKTGEPVVGATLFINEPMIGTTTDAYGYYTIQLPAGRHDLHIRGG